MKLNLKNMGFSLLFLSSSLVILMITITSRLNFSSIQKSFEGFLHYNTVFVFFMSIGFILGLVLIVYSFKGIIRKLVFSISALLLASLIFLYLSPNLIFTNGKIPQTFLEIMNNLYRNNFLRIYEFVGIIAVVFIAAFFSLKSPKKVYKLSCIGLILFFGSISLFNPNFDNNNVLRFISFSLTSLFFCITSGYYLIQQLKLGRQQKHNTSN